MRCPTPKQPAEVKCVPLIQLGVPLEVLLERPPAHPLGLDRFPNRSEQLSPNLRRSPTRGRYERCLFMVDSRIDLTAFSLASFSTGRPDVPPRGLHRAYGSTEPF